VETAFAVRKGSPLADEIPAGTAIMEADFEAVPLVTPLKLRRFLSKWNADLVHAQTSGAHTHAWLACLGSAPLVVSRRVAFHGRGMKLPRLKYRRGTAHYIPISSAAAESLERRGVSGDKMTIVPSGIDIARFKSARRDERLRKSLEGDGGGILAGTVAAMEREKGHMVLVRAAGTILEKCPGMRFVLAGTGKLEPMLRSEVDRCGIGRSFEFVGDEIPIEKLMKAVDLYILPSIQEGLSTGLLAAMAAGLPCIASRVGGIPELLGGGTGILVTPGDHSELAEAVIHLASSSDARLDYSKRSILKAGDFGLDRMVEGTIAVYEKVLGGR
jgi:glycosyltransferase involved in cell wall biosynthesis